LRHFRGQITGDFERCNSLVTEIDQTEARFGVNYRQAGKFFKQSLFNMQDNRRFASG